MVIIIVIIVIIVVVVIITTTTTTTNNNTAPNRGTPSITVNLFVLCYSVAGSALHSWRFPGFL